MQAKLVNTLNQFKAMVLAGMVIIITILANKHGNLDIASSSIGMLMIILISIISLKIKDIIPIKIPAFAYASLLGMLITTPWSPMAETFLKFTGSVSTGQIGTVILAVAGISIGTRLEDIKRLSWKIIIVAFVVFCGTFFGSALISQAILKMQGII